MQSAGDNGKRLRQVTKVTKANPPTLESGARWQAGVGKRADEHA